MAPRKNKRKLKKVAVNAKKNIKKNNQTNIKLKNLLMMIFKSPFLLFNFIIYNLINISKSIILHLYTTIKNILSLFSGLKEALFGILFGLLSGAIGAVIIFSYLDFKNEPEFKIDNKTFSEFQEKVSNLEKELIEAKLNLSQKKMVEEYIKETNIRLENLENISTDNQNKLITNDTNLKDMLSQSSSTTEKLSQLQIQLDNASKLLLSSSKSELSNKLYLAQSVVDRLKSGVPYSPQLVALGQEGLDPALLRFAKGGAPTLSALTARLSVRAGELRDAYMTKSDTSWRDNLKDEISKIVKIRPANSKDIKGVEGVLLRAEEAISRGNLEKAILEINTLEPEARGVLNAWLTEAKAKQNANIAAENLLARTTAALRQKN